MEEALAEIRKKFYDVTDPKPATTKEWEDFLENCTVGLWVGGLGKRFRHILGEDDINKNAHKLPNGKSMAEMTVELFANAGFKKFLAFTNHGEQSIKDVLGDGSKFGSHVTMEYIRDPGPVGRTGALINALNKKVVDETKPLITLNVDDLIFEFDEFPRHLVNSHIQGKKKGNVVTLATYPVREYPGSALLVQDDQVTHIGFHVDIPVPIHLGHTVFDPEAFKYFREYGSLNREVEFETDILPIIAKEGKLGAASFPKGIWIPVNEEKFYKKLIEYLESTD